MKVGSLTKAFQDISFHKKWSFHLIILSLVWFLAGFEGLLISHRENLSIFPNRIWDWCKELVLPFFIFSAFLFSRPTKEDVFWKWNGTLRPVLEGFAFYILIALNLAAILSLLQYVFKTNLMHALHSTVEDLGKIIKTSSHGKNRSYLFFLFVIQGLMAGFFEELWRASMLAGIKKLFPRLFLSKIGICCAVCSVALLFGFGHTYQGWAGVGLTSVLGAFLGGIMIARKSIWPAIFAHTFQDVIAFIALFHFS
jgi:hypothetical protein